jgi:hypothetical protein
LFPQLLPAPSWELITGFVVKEYLCQRRLGGDREEPELSHARTKNHQEKPEAWGTRGNGSERRAKAALEAPSMDQRECPFQGFPDVAAPASRTSGKPNPFLLENRISRAGQKGGLAERLGEKNACP